MPRKKRFVALVYLSLLQYPLHVLCELRDEIERYLGIGPPCRKCCEMDSIQPANKTGDTPGSP